MKCEYWYSLLSFYSKTKGILHKLTKGNSIAAKDDGFLKVYFSMAIEAKELQTEVKGFLRYMNTTYSEKLELIHADFISQTTGEHLCDTTIRSGAMTIVQSGKMNGDVLPNKTDVLARTSISFPKKKASYYPPRTTDSLVNDTPFSR